MGAILTVMPLDQAILHFVDPAHDRPDIQAMWTDLRPGAGGPSPAILVRADDGEVLVEELELEGYHLFFHSQTRNQKSTMAA